MADFFTSLSIIIVFILAFAVTSTYFFLWIQAKRQGISFDEYKGGWADSLRERGWELPGDDPNDYWWGLAFQIPFFAWLSWWVVMESSTFENHNHKIIKFLVVYGFIFVLPMIYESLKVWKAKDEHLGKEEE